MINKTLFSIFKQGSKTYFYSSLFFPTYTKKDVFALYGFVRKADNYVDSIPQDANGFYEFRNKYYKAINGQITGDIVIDSFVELANRKNFDKKWIDAFLKSMEMDIIKNRYQTLDETIDYIYGSAEVIGLMMAKIMNLPKESYNCARHLGRAMQYINFIRDISEDVKLGRIYFPISDLEKHGLTNLDYENIKKQKVNFSLFIKDQLNRYCQWQIKAEEGYRYIPKRYLISIKTASEMYNWTAEQILKNPLIVYSQKVKPQLFKILSTTIMNIIDPRSPKLNNVYTCAKSKIIPQIHEY
jgi:15-cis-phytoene synthase